jgi:hypothetical protein
MLYQPEQNSISSFFRENQVPGIGYTENKRIKKKKKRPVIFVLMLSSREELTNNFNQT